MTKRVVVIHDAAVDEYMSCILLTTMEGVSLEGIVIVNADCIYGPAMDAAWKIQQFIGRTDIPLSLSNARGLNPFPWPYRADCIKQGQIAALAPYGPHPELIVAVVNVSFSTIVWSGTLGDPVSIFPDTTL